MPETEIDRWKEVRLSHWFTSSAGQGFAQALSALDSSGAGAPPDLETQQPNPELWQQWQEPQWFALASDAAEDAGLSVGCAAETARLLVAAIGGEPDQPDDTIQETYRELLQQAAGSLGIAAVEKLGHSIQFGPPAPVSFPTQPDLGIELRFKLSGTYHLLALVPSEALLRVILEDATPDEPAATPQPDARPQLLAGASPQEESAKPAVDQTGKYNLELLLEVELELSVSFGRTRLPLDDVLKLASGSIVELNRSVTDPVDILINDAVVARGEVVVVEGNYGIRVTEVISRKERIRSIF